MDRRYEKTNQRAIVVSAEDCYTQYLEVRDKLSGPPPISNTTCKKIARRILYKIARAIIIENFIFRAPFKMGIFSIVKNKNNSHINKRIDFSKSNFKEGEKKVIYITNLHTSGYYFRWKWFKKPRLGATFKNAVFSQFTPCTDVFNRKVGKRGLAEHIISCANDPFKKDYDAPLASQIR